MYQPCDTLLLRHLSYHCFPTEVAAEFAKKGCLCRVQIAVDNHGKPLGYGFAYFNTIPLATLALDEFQGIKFHGRKMHIRYAGRLIEDQTPMNTLSSPIITVYVRFHTDLLIKFDEEFLETFFVSCGTINDVCIKDVRKVQIIALLVVVFLCNCLTDLFVLFSHGYIDIPTDFSSCTKCSSSRTRRIWICAF